MDDQGIRFADGNVSDVTRVGDTVRRATGPWTPAVHALLRHLEDVGFAGAPRVLGIDERGRETLSFISGETIPPSLDGYRSGDLLVETARLLRRYHDATATFVPPPDARWRFGVGAPRAGEVICHNDVAPWNTVVCDARPVAFIDWDFATPGPPIWDVAYACWRFAPLYAGDSHGTSAERARRMVAFCDAYGLQDRRDLTEVIERRQMVLFESLQTWAQAGIPAFAHLWQEGHGRAILADRSYLRRHRAELDRRLNASSRRKRPAT